MNATLVASHPPSSTIVQDPFLLLYSIFLRQVYIFSHLIAASSQLGSSNKVIFPYLDALFVVDSECQSMPCSRHVQVLPQIWMPPWPLNGSVRAPKELGTYILSCFFKVSKSHLQNADSFQVNIRCLCSHSLSSTCAE